MNVKLNILEFEKNLDYSGVCFSYIIPMAKKNTSQRADPKRFHWSFSEELVNDTFFQQYVGAYGAYMRLVDTTNRRDLKEYYISKATIFIAKIKTRILSDGCFFGVYKGKDEALISDALYPSPNTWKRPLEGLISALSWHL